MTSVSSSAEPSQQVCSLQSAGLPSILRKQLVCALAYQLFLHFLVRLVVKYHTFKDDLLWLYFPEKGCHLGTNRSDNET